MIYDLCVVYTPINHKSKVINHKSKIINLHKPSEVDNKYKSHEYAH
mgnify:CR=1 FL=1